MNELKQPPLGLIPRHIHKEKITLQRLVEVQGAISRAYNKNAPINLEWVEEYNELIAYINEQNDKDPSQAWRD